MYPIAWALLSRKTENTYEKLLDFFKAQFNIKPTKVMTDYESGLRNAVKTVFGEDVKLLGCRFHYTKVKKACELII